MAEVAGGSCLLCDAHVLVRAGGLEPAAGGGVRAELERGRSVLDEFVMKPQGVEVAAYDGKAEGAPAGCEWVRLRQVLAAEAPWGGVACRALGLVNIHLLDHFILTDTECFSMRDAGRLPIYDFKTGTLFWP